MSAFHDEVFLEIDSARKLVAEFKRRPHGSMDQGQARDFPDDTLPKAAHEGESELVAPEMNCPETLANEEDPTDGLRDAAAILREIDEARAMERAAAEEKLRKACEKQQATSGADPARRHPPPADVVRHIWFPGIGASHVWYFSTERERYGPVTRICARWRPAGFWIRASTWCGKREPRNGNRRDSSMACSSGISSTRKWRQHRRRGRLP